jgi:HD-GYP domain-containing protein (c-di-GMP phosphodiesterase class II)
MSTQTDIEAQLIAQLQALEDEDPPSTPHVPFNKEIKKAVQIKDRTRLIVGNVLENARMGKQVTLEPVRDSVKEIIESIHHNPDSILSLSMLKKKDKYTFMHSVNVGVLMIAFCQSIDMDEETITEVGVGGMLHDIGMVRIPDRILNKPGSLTDQEITHMRRHVDLGRRIMERTPGVQQTSLQIVNQHHERLDGSGYPNSLKGDDISLIGQIASIVDIYDAITSDRCYRKSQEPHKVLKKMMNWSKSLIDTDIFQKFVNCVGIYSMGSLVKLDNGLLGVVTQANRESLLHPIINVIIDSSLKKRINPKEINLLDYKDDIRSGYRIRNLEYPNKWKVDPRKFMPTPECYI